MKNTTPKESEEQIAFIKYCDLHHIMAISTQNGMYIPKKSDDGKKDFNHFGYIRRQKAMGLRKGFPDIVIFAQNLLIFEPLLHIALRLWCILKL